MTSISKNVYIDKLNDIVNENNNTYHIAINMKPLDVKDNIYIYIYIYIYICIYIIYYLYSFQDPWFHLEVRVSETAIL